MTWPEGPLLLLLAPAWPLLLALLAAHPRVRARAMVLLPLAPLPALALALVGTQGQGLYAHDLLLGIVLRLDPIGRVMLGMTALLWSAAGVYALGHMRDSRHPAIFTGFWCLTLTGNLGVCLAADMVTFYVAFAAVSLAAYFLVVHDGTAEALRAGRIYIVLAVLGEACLLAAFLIGASAAESLRIADIRAALPGSGQYEVAMLLLVAGFGLKAGLVPLHVWLPLAHSAAPTPASAVLSGGIVKAGIIGMIRFLPDTAEGWGTALVALGLFGAYAGALAGLCQRTPKTVLAYSTVSQMSLLVAAIGAAIAGGGAAGMDAAAFLALHHGLAKGALFLAVGVIAATGRGALVPVLAVTALVALSVAGLPLSGGALAKAAAKPGFEGLALAAMVGSAVTTGLLLLRFLLLAADRHAETPAARPGLLLVLPWLVLAGAALILPWLLLPDWAGLSRAYPMQLAPLWDGFWPILLAALLGLLAMRSGMRAPALPPGDIVLPMEKLAEAAVARARRAGRRRGPPAVMRWPAAVPGVLAQLTARFEGVLSRWPVAGAAILLFALLAFLAGTT